MKKFYSLILIFAITFLSVISFSACSKKNQYNMGNLKSDYKTLTENCTTIKMESDKLVFDYSVWLDGDETYLNNVVSSTEPYTRLNDFYAPILNNAMSFAYSYISVCSNKLIKVNEATMDNLTSSFNTLKSAVKNTDDHISTLAKCVKFEYPNPDYTSITALKSLFKSYNSLIDAALNYNYNIQNIYFNNALTSAIDDYSKYTIETFDANKTMINFKSQTDAQILNLTRAYFNTFVKADSVAESFATNSGSGYKKPDENYTNYMADVASISLGKSFEESLTTKMETINNNAELKQKFYNESVAMSNIQQIMSNDLDTYQTATNDIVYSDKLADANATDYEKFCVQMIENHNYIVAEYNKVLINIINLINNAGA